MGSPALEAFAAEVGPRDPVTCVGGRTAWEVGGAVDPSAREVRAPAGVVRHEPAEMIVRVRAGTTLAELSAVLAEGGQRVTLEAEHPEHATVGGLLSVGRAGPRRLAWGPPRDSVLEVVAVGSDGELFKAGAPLVKNVTGFDLCRLLVGSLGTLAFLAEVVLRTKPLAELEGWWVGEGADPFELLGALFRPVALLWDGQRTWVGLEGLEADVAAQAEHLVDLGFASAPGPPTLPGPGRSSWAPSRLPNLPRHYPSGGWLAQVGVGLVHSTVPEGLADPEGPTLPPGHTRASAEAARRRAAGLEEELKRRFDPEGRLNPGRVPPGREGSR